MRRNRLLGLASILLALTLGANACGDLKRDNPVDSAINGGQTLRDQLLGAWSRINDEKNEIYSFTVVQDKV